MRQFPTTLRRLSVFFLAASASSALFLLPDVAAADPPGPTAFFAYAPASPLPGDVITFTSASAPGAGHVITTETWDLDNDGRFDDGIGPTVKRSFGSPGPITVRLRVEDDHLQEAVASQVVVIGNQPPTASFVYAPAQPLAGNAVSLFATSTDPDSQIESHSWDLDGDGSFDDATGSTASLTFPLPGSYRIGLEVADGQGSSAVAHETLLVGAPTAASARLARLLSPFPIIRVAGSIRKRGIRLGTFTVSAPIGATVAIRCAGGGCPFRRHTRIADGPPATAQLPTSMRLVRVRPLERRLLRTGVIVRVFVTKPGAIGKYTRFRVRKRRPPFRTDRCLTPGSALPVQCPVLDTD